MVKMLQPYSLFHITFDRHNNTDPFRREATGEEEGRHQGIYLEYVIIRVNAMEIEELGELKPFRRSCGRKCFQGISGSMNVSV